MNNGISTLSSEIPVVFNFSKSMRLFAKCSVFTICLGKFCLLSFKSNLSISNCSTSSPTSLAHLCPKLQTNPSNRGLSVPFRCQNQPPPNHPPKSRLPTWSPLHSTRSTFLRGPEIDHLAPRPVSRQSTSQASTPLLTLAEAQHRPPSVPDVSLLTKATTAAWLRCAVLSTIRLCLPRFSG